MAPALPPLTACIPGNQISLSLSWPQALGRRELELLDWLGEGGPLPAASPKGWAERSVVGRQPSPSSRPRRHRDVGGPFPGLLCALKGALAFGPAPQWPSCFPAVSLPFQFSPWLVLHVSGLSADCQGGRVSLTEKSVYGKITEAQPSYPHPPQSLPPGDRFQQPAFSLASLCSLESHLDCQERKR